MSDHEPPTPLDKPPPGDDHAAIRARVARLEIIVEEVIRRLTHLEASLDSHRKEVREEFRAMRDDLRAMNAKFEAKFDMLFRMIFSVLAIFAAGLLAMIGRPFGLY